MSKGKYSAQNFQAWFSKKSDNGFSGQELVVGIDVSKIAFYAAVMSGGWRDFDVLYFERDDIPAFIARLSELDFAGVTLVLEPTGTYGDALLDQAREAGFKLIRVSGSDTHKAKALFDGVPSMHDGKAAYTLARLYLCGVGNQWKLRCDADRDLRALDDQAAHLQKMEGQLVNPLEAHLARHWPEVTDYLDLKSATLLELLKTYGSPQEVAAHKKKARALMKKVGGHFLCPDKIEAVLRSAESTIGVSPTVFQIELLQYYATMLRTHMRRSAVLNRRIEELSRQDERLKNLADWAGKRTALAMVARVGDFTAYEAPQGLENGFGLTLCEHTTGQTHQDRSGDHLGLLYMMVLRMISPVTSIYCPIATAWYAERLERNGGIKKKALVALMRKVVRALFWVARGATYDPEKLFDTRRLRRLGHLI